MDNPTPSPAFSPATQAILAGIDDTDLRDQVTATAQCAQHALAQLDRLHLPQDHFEVGTDLHGHNRYPELAPYVLQAVTAINGLLENIAASYPAPPEAASNTAAAALVAAGGEAAGDDFDFDFEFDLNEPSTGSGAPGAGAGDASDDGPADTHGAAATAAADPGALVADVATAFGGMLRSRTVNFGERLQRALDQADSWALLAELDDHQHGLRKAVQAILFGLLGVFDPATPREEILPQYRSGLQQAVTLRAALADLTYHITRFNDALGEANQDRDEALPLVVAIADRLSRFASTPAYRSLRAEDKKATVDFRAALYEHRTNPNTSWSALQRAVEGFSKFLEAMQAINQREVLVVHDQQALAAASDKLDAIAAAAEAQPDQAQSQLDGLVEALGDLVGRSPELDAARRDHLEHPDNQPPLGEAVPRWQAVLQNAQMMAR